MKKTLTILLFLFSFKLGISQCGRSTPFTADINLNTNGRALNAGLNLGLFNTTNLSFQLGGRVYSEVVGDKSESKRTIGTPTATVLLKSRFNGNNSDIVHAIGFSSGLNNFREVSYRIYNANYGDSFGSIGWMVSYSNVQGVMFGFIAMGIF
jgi:hypothetical protein